MMKISIFVVCTVLVTINQTLAQDQSSLPSLGSQPSGNQQPNMFGFPFPFQIPHFQIPFLNRQQRAAAEPAATPAEDSDTSNDENDDHQNRFFFHLFSPPSTYVSCNSTTQAGASCTSCTQALSCGSNDVGRLQQCRGFLPYCNVGRCSFFPGQLCNNATG